MPPNAPYVTMPQPRPDSVPDDALELVRQAQSGDEAAFERLYRLHVGRVYAVCLRLSASRERAERLTQDAFVLAWRRLGSFRGDSAFGTWLHRVAVNVALMDVRARQRRMAHLQDGVDLEGLEQASRPPSGDAAMDLEAAIAALPERARAVLVLHDVEGYLHAEIAQRMGIAIGTSKAHLHRARRLVQQWLKR